MPAGILFSGPRYVTVKNDFHNEGLRVLGFRVATSVNILGGLGGLIHWIFWLIHWKFVDYPLNVSRIRKIH